MAQQRKILKPTYNLSGYRNSHPQHQQQKQPKASSSNSYRSSAHQLSSSAFRNDDNLTITMPPQRSRAEMPSLIPLIASKGDSSLTNGHNGLDDINRSINFAGHVRGRKTVFEMGKKSIPYSNSPSSLLPKSVISQQKHMEVKEKYDDLLMQLGCYKFESAKAKEVNRAPIATIDLSDEVDFSINNNNNIQSLKNSSLSKFILSDEIRKHDLMRSKIVLSDEDDDNEDDEDFEEANFSRRETIFSSTFVKPTPGHHQNKYTSHNAKLNYSSTNKASSSSSSSGGNTLTVLIPDVKPINTLKEKQAFNKACEPDAIEKICQKFKELRQVKDQNIHEEQLK